MGRQFHAQYNIALREDEVVGGGAGESSEGEDGGGEGVRGRIRLGWRGR